MNNVTNKLSTIKKWKKSLLFNLHHGSPSLFELKSVRGWIVKTMDRYYRWCGGKNVLFVREKLKRTHLITWSCYWALQLELSRQQPPPPLFLIHTLSHSLNHCSFSFLSSFSVLISVYIGSTSPNPPPPLLPPKPLNVPFGLITQL